jgi:hypothetical protein
MLLKQVWPHEGSAENAVVFELDVEVVGLCVVVFGEVAVVFGVVVVVFGVVVGKFTDTLVVPGDVQFPYKG